MPVVPTHNHRSAARALALLCSTALAGAIAAPAWADGWNGSVSPDWFDPGNWVDGTVPTAADNVNLETTTPNSTVIDGGDAAAGQLIVGQFGSGELTIINGGSLISALTRIGNDPGSQGGATVAGPGSTWNISSDLVVGTAGIGSLTIAGGGMVTTSARAAIGVSAGGEGTVTVTGAGSHWDLDSTLIVGIEGTGALTVADGGTVSATQMTIAGNAGSVGTLNVGAAAGDPAAAPGIIDAPSIVLGEGDGTINFKHTASSYAFAPSIRGAGTVNVLQGSTIFTGENTYTGTTNVAAGATLQIGNGGNTGSLASDAVVNGSLIFDRTGELTYAGAISGDGALTKQGAGTLTLTGDSAFTDDTAIADGTLAITDGGTVSNADGMIAVGAGSMASVNVTGQGSTWSNDNLTVGYDGAGELNVTGGGEVNSSITATIGGWPGHHGTGKATVSGDGSTWNALFSLNVGYNSTGELTIANGGEVSQQSGYLGAGLGGAGTVLVTGTGSKWISRDSLSVGSLGVGELTVEESGYVESVTGYIGVYADPRSQGTVTITGQNSIWNNSGELYIGGGTGTLSVADGGTVSATEMTIAVGAGSVGTLNIGAAAGDPAAAPGIIDAPSIVLGEGDGTINFKHTASSYMFTPSISGAGTVNVLLGPTIFTGENTYTGTTNIIAGATLQIGNGGNTGSLASDAVVNGALIFDRTGELTYAGATSGSGRLSKRGNGTLTLTGDNEVGLFAIHDGTLAVDGGTLDQTEQPANLSNTIGEAGGEDAALVITNGGKVTTANGTYLGYSSGSQGSVTVSGNGSSLNAVRLQVGNYGDGTLSVKDNGHASFGGLWVGASNDGTQGTGTFSVSGATADVSTLYIGYSEGSTGAVTVSDGGTLDVENLIYMAPQNTTSTADLNIGAASTDAADAAAPGIFKGGEIRFYQDNARLNFNHTGDAYVFDTPLTRHE